MTRPAAPPPPPELLLFEECVAPIAMPNGETRCGEPEEAPIHNTAHRGGWHEYQPTVRQAHNRSWPNRCRCGEQLHPSWKGYALHLEESIFLYGAFLAGTGPWA